MALDPALTVTPCASTAENSLSENEATRSTAAKHVNRLAIGPRRREGAMSRNRSKAKGRRDPGERFALLPRDMLLSPAYLSLTHADKSYLTALAAEFNGMNNGRINHQFIFSRSVNYF